MSRTSSTQVTTDDRAVRDDSLATEDNILWTCNRRATRHLVTRVLTGFSSIGQCITGVC